MSDSLFPDLDGLTSEPAPKPDRRKLPPWPAAAFRLLPCVDDHDGITHAQLKAAIKAGWRGVSREQTYAQACKVYDDPADAPPGYSVFDWHTHLGVCPECVPGYYGEPDAAPTERA